MDDPHHLDSLVNELISRVLGASFLVLVVALGVALLVVGAAGMVRTRRRRGLAT